MRNAIIAAIVAAVISASGALAYSEGEVTTTDLDIQNRVQHCQIAKLNTRVAILERGASPELLERLANLRAWKGACAGRPYPE